MDTNEQNQQDKRELRHKRRQRNQIIAYTVVGIMILLLAVGIAFAVSKITGMNHDRQEQQNKLDDIIASEETITAPTEPVETVPIHSIFQPHLRLWSQRQDFRLQSMATVRLLRYAERRTVWKHWA